jgi:hypothetical protein
MAIVPMRASLKSPRNVPRCPGLTALRHYHVHAALFEPQAFAYGGRGAHRDNAGVAEPAQLLLIRNTEGKAEDRYALLEDYLELVVEALLERGRRLWGLDAQLLPVGLKKFV